jgi:hypothetical protein
MSEVLQEIHRILEIVGAPLITLAGVWLGWRLSSSSQRVQRRLDNLKDRFAALAEFMQIVENVPPDLSRAELVSRVASDQEFRGSLAHRLTRLFGLRTELVASLDREVVGFIDRTLRPLFGIGVGLYELHPDRVAQFGAAAFELRPLAQRVEKRLLAEYERLTR